MYVYDQVLWYLIYDERSRPHPCEFLAYIQSFLPCEPTPTIQEPVPTPTEPITYEPPVMTQPTPVHGFEPVQPSLDRVYYYHGDHLGSSTYVTDNNGRPVAYYDYLPFGEVAVEHNQTTNFNNGYKFNAKELDEATGMYYYGARYYDPRLSIFVSVDPLVEKTFEPYSYVGNNPIMFIDPTGMSKEKIVPSKIFLSKPYGHIHNTLMKSNSIYNSLLNKYKNSNNFNYYLYVNDKRKLAGSRASTEIREAYIREQFIGIEGKTFYQDKGVDKFSEIAIAKTLIHEAAHLKIASENNTTKDDNNHDYFASENYASVIKNALMEYNAERKLGYSEEELEALSWEGIHTSDAFKSYINDKMKKNDTSYDTEYNKWKKQVEDIRNIKKEY